MGACRGRGRLRGPRLSRARSGRSRRGGRRRCSRRARCGGRHRGSGRSSRYTIALQPFQPGCQRQLVPRVDSGQQNPRADQLQLQPRRRRPPHLGEALVEDVGGARQLGGTETAACACIRSTASAGASIRPLSPRPAPRRGPPGRGAAPAGRRRSGAGRGRPRSPGRSVSNTAAPSPAANASTTASSSAGVGVAEQGTAPRVRDALARRAREQLVEDGQRVTRRPRRRRGRPAAAPPARRGCSSCAAGSPRGSSRSVARRDQPERVVVGARPDRRRCTFSGSVVAKMNFRCSGGSSTSLSSALKPCRRDHVRLVDDVDLVPARDRREEGLLAQVTGVVDATVRGGVDLDDVDGARPVGRERHGRSRTPRTGRASGPLAVQASGPGSARWWSSRTRAAR